MRQGLVTLLFAVAAIAQPQFEVASIRQTAVPTGTEGSGRERVDISATNVSLRNASLSFVIQWADDLQFYQVDGPEWLKGQRYDILAKAPAPSSEKEMRLMMRALLSERFKVAMHSEKLPRPIYSLVVNDKLKIQPAGAGDTRSFEVTTGSFVFRATTMAQFADQLSDFATVDRPVIDNTALSGPFNFTLDSAARAIRGGDGPSIFTAVSEIGLRMRPVNEPLEVWIVDSAERKPSEN